MPKQIRVALLPELLFGNPDNSIVVVIDTLRFTTTACQAFAAGAKQISVVADVEGARSLASQTSPKPLLCGERLCRPIPGFDLGNSPYEYTREVVGDRALIFSTTNGTRAVAAARYAQRIFLGSIVNRNAIARAILTPEDSPVYLLCSGTDGEVAGEDLLAAGAIINAAMSIDKDLQLGNDSAGLAWNQWKPFEALDSDSRQLALVNAFQQFSGGINLVEQGYSRDLEFSASVDLIPIAPCSVPMNSLAFVADHANLTDEPL